jgi:two-component system phosphate regulon sensor histidine kinase PhoR
MNAPTPLIVLLIVALAIAAALFYYSTRLRAERQTLQRELRRVLRAGAGRVEAQHEELSWLRALSEDVPMPVVVTDENRRMIYANPAAEQLFGEVRTGEGAIARLRHHRLEGMLATALEKGHSEPESIEMPGEQHYLAVAYAWPAESSQWGGALLFLQDVTERDRLARARRDMAANLSHELRTPLSSIKLLSESLLGSITEEPDLARKFALRIAAENEALIRLVEDLTTLAAIESGRTPLRLERINLRELVSERLQRLAPQQEQKRLRFDLDSPECPIVALDPERFGQILNNLLDNAIRFSPEGGSIHLSIRETPEGTTLTIRDEGSGILPKDLPRIFERFYKGDTARTRAGSDGTGLGLAIVRHLVEAHGGSIKADS